MTNEQYALVYALIGILVMVQWLPFTLDLVLNTDKAHQPHETIVFFAVILILALQVAIWPIVYVSSIVAVHQTIQAGDHKK